MFIGYDYFGLNLDGNVFNTLVCHPSYFQIEMFNGIYDQIFIDRDITIPVEITKPNDWTFTTVLNAKFQNNLEGGSISAGGLVVERIRFQKRKTDELIWQDVAEIEYNAGEQFLYEAIDKYIQNDFSYQYTLVPITATILGDRLTSSEITADFEGIFISDKDNNYRLLYNAEFGDKQHNNPSSIHEPLNSKYPIVTYSELDYSSGDVNALFLSTSTVDNNTGKIDIRMEKLGREQLLLFLKNRKPKVLRSQNGETMLITIVGNPRETHNNSINGIANVSFSYVEIGKFDGETLKLNGMLEGLTEVF